MTLLSEELTKVSPVYTRATEMYKALVSDTRTNGEKFYKLKDESPEWMSEVIQKVHGDSFPDDTIYELIHKVSRAISEADKDTEDWQDVVSDIESDIYTHDLTAWLHRRVDHVYFLSEALEELLGDFRDGFELLAYAQHLQIEEVGFKLLEALETNIIVDNISLVIS